MGLVSASTVRLSQARELAARVRSLLKDGRNPLDERTVARKLPTFGEMADGVIASLEPAWRNPKHRDQWRMTLSKYCAPMRDLPVDIITTHHVLGVLQAFWLRVPETADRLRGRIEKVLDAAKAKGHRAGENPARWRGHLDHLLPARPRLARGHHKALSYRKVPDLISQLRELGSISAFCLEFTILTAARSGEAMGARWDEIDLNLGIWVVPGRRMKAGREHRVPLPARTQEIVATMAALRAGVFVFPGAEAEPRTVDHGARNGVAAPQGRSNGAWLPKLLPGLGGRADRGAA